MSQQSAKDELRDPLTSRIKEAKDLIKYLNLEKTIFYFDGTYHAVKNDWLTEIPAEEAEQDLNSHEFDLWNLGNPPGALPKSCPSYICTYININAPAGQFLQLVFDLHYKEQIINKTSTN